MKSLQKLSCDDGKGLGRLAFLVCVLLLAATAWAYQDLPRHDFVNFDDIEYITGNPRVRAGISIEGVVWAFTTTHAGNWHPLTWLSHMLDVQLFGLHPGMHHLVNLLLHMANSVLFFLLLWKMTGAFWRSAICAALFALHPLHVESVAWISERKDVLSTFFLILTIRAYVWYAEKPGWRRYVCVSVLLILGLLSKPMLVTLPFLMLVLDSWPLGRFHGNPGETQVLRRANVRFLKEKVPWVILVIALCVLTYWAQKEGGLVLGLHVMPLDLRLANTLLSYAGYIGKTIWPQSLGVYYPHPETVPLWQAAGVALGLALLTFLFLVTRKRRPHLLAGWLWYVGTLVPVIGLVHVGGQAMADRYTYIPIAGLFILLVWSIPNIAGMAKWRSMSISAIVLGLLVICGILTRMQVEHWRDSTSLWKQALSVTDRNYVAHNMLGGALAREGKRGEAMAHFLEALRINPNYEKAHYYLGLSRMEEKRYEEALAHLARALELRCDFPQVVYDKQGEILLLQGKEREAQERFEAALQVDPSYGPAHIHLGTCLERSGRTAEAVSHYSKALEIDPFQAVPRFLLGRILLAQGRAQEAAFHYSEALRTNPELPEAHYNLGVVAEQQGRGREAISFFRDAVALRPDDVEARNNLGAALAREGRCREAVMHFSAVLRIRPDHEAAARNLAICQMELQVQKR